LEGDQEEVLVDVTLFVVTEFMCHNRFDAIDVDLFEERVKDNDAFVLPKPEKVCIGVI